MVILMFPLLVFPPISSLLSALPSAPGLKQEQKFCLLLRACTYLPLGIYKKYIEVHFEKIKSKVEFLNSQLV